MTKSLFMSLADMNISSENLKGLKVEAEYLGLPLEVLIIACHVLVPRPVQYLLDIRVVR